VPNGPPRCTRPAIKLAKHSGRRRYAPLKVTQTTVDLWGVAAAAKDATGDLATDRATVADSLGSRAHASSCDPA